MPMIKQHEAPSLLAQSPSPDTTTKREREEEKGRKEKSSSVPGLETKTHWYILAKSLPGEENLCSRAEFGSLKQVPRNESHHSYMKSDGTGSGRGNESDSGADADVAGAVRQRHCERAEPQSPSPEHLRLFSSRVLDDGESSLTTENVFESKQP